MKNFEKVKIDFNIKNMGCIEYDCFLPIHLTKNKIEKHLRNKDGSVNEQYYKWEFLESYVASGLCSKDYIHVC